MFALLSSDHFSYLGSNLILSLSPYLFTFLFPLPPTHSLLSTPSPDSLPEKQLEAVWALASESPGFDTWLYFFLVAWLSLPSLRIQVFALYPNSQQNLTPPEIFMPSCIQQVFY